MQTSALAYEIEESDIGTKFRRTCGDESEVHTITRFVTVTAPAGTRDWEDERGNRFSRIALKSHWAPVP